MSSDPLYQPGTQVPGTVYQVLRLLAQGGMGFVYDVEDVTVGKRYVLKTLTPELLGRKDLARRMAAEARVLAKLSHPNIVDVITAGTTQDERRMPYFVMERLNGQSLRTVLDKKGALDLPLAQRIAIDVLDALAHAHDNGVVHRDVKPDNIFLHRTPVGTTVTKLLDFGVMHLVDSNVDDTRGRFVGTVRYAAPEQVLGRGVGPAADLYATGLVLYEMVAGVGPWDELHDMAELANAQVNEAPPALSQFANVPPEFEALVMSALAKDPDARPADAFAFAADLRRMLKQAQRAVSTPAAPAKEPSAADTVLASTRLSPGAASAAATPPSSLLASAVPVSSEPDPYAALASLAHSGEGHEGLSEYAKTLAGGEGFELDGAGGVRPAAGDQGLTVRLDSLEARPVDRQAPTQSYVLDALPAIPLHGTQVGGGTQVPPSSLGQQAPVHAQGPLDPTRAGALPNGLAFAPEGEAAPTSAPLVGESSQTVPGRRRRAPWLVALLASLAVLGGALALGLTARKQASDVELPSADLPAAAATSAEQPASEAPVAESPGTEALGAEPVVAEPLASEAPVAEAPSAELPLADAPSAEALQKPVDPPPAVQAAAVPAAKASGAAAGSAKPAAGGAAAAATGKSGSRTRSQSKKCPVPPCGDFFQ